MSKIIYSSKLTPQFDYAYFSIPVYVIKLYLTVEKDVSLNHFERVVLKLLNFRYYTSEEISNLLTLERDLIEAVEHNLQEKGLIDEKYKVTEKGIDSIKQTTDEKVTEVGYVFYDLNRKCIFNDIYTEKDFKITESNETNSGFRITSDASDADVRFTNLKAKNINNTSSLKDEISKQIYRIRTKSIFKFEILNLDYSVYNLISYIKVDETNKTSNFYVCDPISLENSQELYYYLSSNYKDEKIGKLILRVLENNNHSKQNIEYEDEKNLKIVKNKLFIGGLKPMHEYLAPQIYETIKALNDIKEDSFYASVVLNDHVKNSMVHMGDLYENVLYLIAQQFKNSEDVIYKLNKHINLQDELLRIANKIGFNVSEEAKALLNVRRNNIISAIKNPNKKTLSECIAWNLYIAYQNKNHFFYKIVKDYPELLSNLYTFKREYRDKNKHGNSFATLSPKIYFDILFKIFDEGLGYKIVYKELRNIYITGSEDASIKEATGYLKQSMSDEFMNSNDDFITKMRTTLISMTSSYLTAQPKFLNIAYGLIDEILKKMLVVFKHRYVKEIKSLDLLFNNKEEIIEFLKENNITTESLSDNIETKIEDLIQFNKDYKYAFKTNYKNSVIAEEVTSLIIMMKQNISVLKTIKEVPNLIIIARTLSKICKHQQVKQFDQDVAIIVYTELIDLIKTLDTNFMNGGK